MQVFISHSSKDEVLVRRIADVLKASGMDVWDDTREIMPGENYAEKVAQALKESEAMIVLLTSEGINSKWMRWEIEYALGRAAFNKRVIPVTVGDPKELTEGNVPWILRHFKTVNLPENGASEENIRRIADVLQEAA